MGESYGGLHFFRQNPPFGPEINIYQNTHRVPNNGSVDAGGVEQGSSSLLTFTVKNPGSQPLELTDLPPIEMTGSGDFVVTRQPGSTIAGGSNDTFAITFTPSAQGEHTATISITSNDSDETPYVFTVNGTGRRPSYILWTHPRRERPPCGK